MKTQIEKDAEFIREERRLNRLRNENNKIDVSRFF